MGKNWRKLPATVAPVPGKPERPLVDFEAAIIAMDIGDCLEADALVTTIRVRLWNMKQRLHWDRRFTLRQESPYFTRIWRLA
jgi:hypothetical protein